MHDDDKTQHLLDDAVGALAKARLTLVAVVRTWHRAKEDAALRYAIEQMDHAGTAICEIQNRLDVEGQSEQSRQRSHQGL